MKSTLLQKTFLGIFLVFFSVQASPIVPSWLYNWLNSSSSQGDGAHWFFGKIDNYWEKLNYNFKQHSSEMPVRITEHLITAALLSSISYGTAYFLNKLSNKNEIAVKKNVERPPFPVNYPDKLRDVIDIFTNRDVARNCGLDQLPSIGYTLAGKTGVGKTTMCEAFVAEIQEKLGNKSDVFLVYGKAAKWQKGIVGSGVAEADKFLAQVKRLLEANEKNIVVGLIDEIDSIPKRSARGTDLATEDSRLNNNIFDEFNEMFKEKRYKGRFIILGTTNNSNDVDEALIGRLPVQNIPDLTLEQKKGILTQALDDLWNKNRIALGKAARDLVLSEAFVTQLSNYRDITTFVEHMKVKLFKSKLKNCNSKALIVTSVHALAALNEVNDKVEGLIKRESDRLKKERVSQLIKKQKERNLEQLDAFFASEESKILLKNQSFKNKNGSLELARKPSETKKMISSMV